MALGTTYRANVSRTTDQGVFVKIPMLGNAEYGPLEIVVCQHASSPLYMPGDKVLVVQAGRDSEDFIITGLVVRYTEA